MEAVAIEGEADRLFADPKFIAVCVHQLPEGGGLLDPELHRGAATLVRHGQVDVLVVSASAAVHTGLGLCSFGFDVLHDAKIKYQQKRRLEK